MRQCDPDPGFMILLCIRFPAKGRIPVPDPAAACILLPAACFVVSAAQSPDQYLRTFQLRSDSKKADPSSGGCICSIKDPGVRKPQIAPVLCPCLLRRKKRSFHVNAGKLGA